MNHRFVFFTTAFSSALVLSTVFFVGCSTKENAPKKTAGFKTTDTKPAKTDEKPPVDLLIEVSDLMRRLQDDQLRILDTRSAEEYEKSHIVGAVHVDVADWKQLSLAEGGLHNKEAWPEKISKLGIERESTNVVVYSKDGGDISNAARIWWLLKYLGVEHVAVLNGGFDLWSGMPVDFDFVLVSTEVSAVESVEFMPAFQTGRLAKIADLKPSINTDEVNIVDARSLIEFRGTGGAGARKGHFPRAKHIEWTKLLAPDGRFKSPQDLRQLFEKKHSLAPGKTTVTHCQTGGRSSVDALALELAGYKQVKNYYNGWMEWSADTEAPVEKE